MIHCTFHPVRKQAKIEKLQKYLCMATNQRFEEIVEVIGFDQTVKLTKEIGGTITHIPKDQIPEEFIQILGTADATKLCRHFQSGRLHVPIASFVYRNNRDKSICQDFYSGVKVRALALQWHLSERTINSILARYRNDQQCKSKSRIADPD